MKHHQLILWAMAALAFASCDKVEQGNYLNQSSGGGTTWSDPRQHAFVEKYTGPSCSFCPLADQTLSAARQRYGEQLVIISINDGFTGQGAPHRTQPDFRTDEGTAWEEYAIGTASGIPSALLGRNRNEKYESAMSNIIPAIGEVLSQSAIVTAGVDAVNMGDSIVIEIFVDFLQDYDAPTTLTLALTEDSLVYYQTLPMNRGIDSNYVHNHMLRDVITSVWGMDIEAGGHAGESRQTRLVYKDFKTLSPAPVLDNCHIVAFVSDKATRRVLNASESVIYNHVGD